MSADNFLVLREQPNGKWSVRMAFLSGWSVPRSSDEKIDAYLFKHTWEVQEGLQDFDTEDLAHDYCDMVERSSVVEYGREIFRRRPSPTPRVQP